MGFSEFLSTIMKYLTFIAPYVSQFVGILLEVLSKQEQIDNGIITKALAREAVVDYSMRTYAGKFDYPETDSRMLTQLAVRMMKVIGVENSRELANFLTRYNDYWAALGTPTPHDETDYMEFYTQHYKK